MKVLIVGGPDVDRRVSLIQNLKKHFFVSVLGSDKGIARTFEQAGIDYGFYRLNRGANPVADLSTIGQLTRIIRWKGANIVHTFDTKPGVWGRLAAKMAGVPVVIGTLPGLGSLYSENNFRTRTVRNIYQPLQKLACHASDLTIFQNHEDAVQFTDNGIVPANKTAILPGSGVDSRTFDPNRFSGEQRRHIRARMGLNETSVVVTMISRLIRSKGVLEFAQAARTIQQQHPKAVFLLVGPNDFESVDALTSAEREEVCNSATWLGARDDVSELLAISDILVLPTYYREGIPRVLLEAASMGLPIVATQLPGCTEVVLQNVNGFLVTARDLRALKEAVVKLILDPSLRLRFGQASRQRTLSHFDLTIIAERTTSVYRRLLAQKGYGNTANS